MIMSKKYAIGIDLGGTNLRVALVSEEGEIIRKVKKSSSEEVLGSLLESIEAINNSDVVGIGLERQGFQLSESACC
jgi:glucokinase